MNSPKNPFTTLLLAFFLGNFGIHRFYVGKIFTGILMLFTFGGLGIWWLIDIIFIITGEFRDAHGLKIRSENFRFSRFIKPAGIFLLICSALLLIGAGFAYQSARSFVDHSVKSIGKITDIRESVSDGTTYYYPTYTFTDASGASHTVHSSAGSNPPDYSVGDAVEILYVQDSPTKAKINSFFSLWGLPTVLSILGGIDLLFGFILIIVAGFIKRSSGETLSPGYATD